MMGYDMFDEMTAGITEDTVRLLMHIQVEQKVEREQVAKVTGTNKDEGPSVKGPAREQRRRYILMIHAHAEVARNIRIAAEDRHKFIRDIRARNA